MAEPGEIVERLRGLMEQYVYPHILRGGRFGVVMENESVDVSNMPQFRDGARHLEQGPDLHMHWWLVDFHGALEDANDDE